MNLFKFAVPSSFVFLLALSMQVNAAPGTYHYAVRIPAGQQTCQAEADTLKNNFSTASKAEVTASICRETLDIQADGSPYKLYSLLLTYQADQEIVPYAASFGLVGITNVPDLSGGIYNSYKDCLADIGVQTQNFQAATQLTAIDAFCSPAEGESAVVYRLQIDGLGKKAQTLFIFNPSFAGAEDPQTKTDLEHLITILGGSITKELGSQVYYYAKAPVELRNNLLGFFTKADECTSQLTDANTIFTKANAKNIIARCLVLPQATTSKDEGTSYSLEVISDGDPVSHDYGLTYKYYSFGECVNDKARLLADAGDWGWGAICSPSLDLTGQYSLDLFHR